MYLRICLRAFNKRVISHVLVDGVLHACYCSTVIVRLL